MAVRAPESRGVKLPAVKDGDIGHLTSAICEFGEFVDVLLWRLEHGEDIEQRGANNWTPLHYACNRGYLNAVKTLVAKGANVNATTIIDGGYTPLMEACAHGHFDVVVELLKCGADPHAINSFERINAEEMASQHGFKNVVELLQRHKMESRKRSRK